MLTRNARVQRPPTIKRLFRLYREERLAARRPQASDWNPRTYDDPNAAHRSLVARLRSDQLTDGRRFRILTIVDDCTRECLALLADTSLSGMRVARELDGIIAKRGKPRMIVSDIVLWCYGSEFTSNAILARADKAKVNRNDIAIWQADADWLH